MFIDCLEHIYLIGEGLRRVWVQKSNIVYSDGYTVEPWLEHFIFEIYFLPTKWERIGHKEFGFVAEEFSWSHFSVFPHCALRVDLISILILPGSRISKVRLHNNSVFNSNWYTNPTLLNHSLSICFNSWTLTFVWPSERTYSTQMPRDLLCVVWPTSI